MADMKKHNRGANGVAPTAWANLGCPAWGSVSQQTAPPRVGFPQALAGVPCTDLFRLGRHAAAEPQRALRPTGTHHGTTASWSDNAEPPQQQLRDLTQSRVPGSSIRQLIKSELLVPGVRRDAGPSVQTIFPFLVSFGPNVKSGTGFIGKVSQ